MNLALRRGGTGEVAWLCVLALFPLPNSMVCFPSGARAGAVGSLASMAGRSYPLLFTHPLPYGAIIHDGGVQFVVFSRRATAMRVLLYDSLEAAEPAEIVEFDPDRNRWGDIWSIFVPGVGPASSTTFRPTALSSRSRACGSTAGPGLIDPYAKALAGRFLPGRRRHCPAAQVRGRQRRLRLGRRPAPAPQPGRDRDLRDARPRLHLPPSERREPSGHVPRADREDSLPRIARRHGGRVDAGLRVSHQRMDRRAVAAAELLGLRSLALFRPAPRLRRRPRARLPGPRVQGDGAGAAPGRASK